ncbi:MAG TPA: helix-turn-helix transcriptional regulator [Bacilli bacterium]|jgi:transcriptional regulator with XRE-family HTH domain|nr:helix-turn-helix transcriptional regulator [Bacilli bacterium]HQC32401.1 helix-turn-helix transcriptional regulator [Bacilli bacterium]
MNETEFKRIVADNIAFYRKQMGLTQLQLAEKLNYSDKAISKWERGESLPEVYVLHSLASFFGVTLNDFLTVGRKPRTPLTIKTRILISILSAGIVWLVATVIFVLTNLIEPNIDFDIWLVFIYAIPLSSIVLLVFSLLWGNNRLSFAFVTALSVGLTLSIYLSLFKFYPHIWYIFIVLVPIEILALFWFIFRKIRKVPTE